MGGSLSRVWMEAPSFRSGPVLSFLAWSSGAHGWISLSFFGGLLDLLLLVGRSSSARGPDTARTGRSMRLLATTSPNERAYERAYGTCRREARARKRSKRDDAKGSRNSLPVSFMGLCK